MRRNDIRWGWDTNHLDRLRLLWSRAGLRALEPILFAMPSQVILGSQVILLATVVSALFTITSAISAPATVASAVSTVASAVSATAPVARGVHTQRDRSQLARAQLGP